MGKKKKYYVVWQGRIPGVFKTWEDTRRSIDGFPGARYKSFESRIDAETAYGDHPDRHISRKAPVAKKAVSGLKGKPVLQSIAVDAACSGNPGKMEYQGVDVETGSLIFHQGPFEQGTNNIGEFLGIVHALAWLKNKNLPSKIIYSDSKIAIGWVKKKKCATKLTPNNRNAKLFDLIHRAENWLKENAYYNPILKWETSEWGEIPADFGRK